MWERRRRVGRYLLLMVRRRGSWDLGVRRYRRARMVHLELKRSPLKNWSLTCCPFAAIMVSKIIRGKSNQPPTCVKTLLMSLAANWRRIIFWPLWMPVVPAFSFTAVCPSGADESAVGFFSVLVLMVGVSCGRYRIITVYCGTLASDRWLGWTLLQFQCFLAGLVAPCSLC